MLCAHTGGTFTLLKEFFPNKMNITTTFVHLDDTDAVAAAIRPNTRVVYAETLSNPTLRVADIPALAEIAHAKVLTWSPHAIHTLLAVRNLMSFFRT